MNAKDIKAGMRAERLALRDAIPVETRAAMSLAMAEHAGEAIVFDPGTIISGFLPIRWEHDCANRLPVAADKSLLTPMDTTKLQALGWQPGGLPLFEETIHALATQPAA